MFSQSTLYPGVAIFPTGMVMSIFRNYPWRTNIANTRDEYGAIGCDIDPALIDCQWHASLTAMRTCDSGKFLQDFYPFLRLPYLPLGHLPGRLDICGDWGSSWHQQIHEGLEWQQPAWGLPLTEQLLGQFQLVVSIIFYHQKTSFDHQKHVFYEPNTLIYRASSVSGSNVDHQSDYKWQ